MRARTASLAFKPWHLFIRKKEKRHELSIRFDSSNFPFFASEKLTKALPRVLLLLFNPPLAEPRHHWRKLCKPQRMDLVRFQTNQLQMCLWTIEDAATSFRIHMNSIMLTGSQQHSHHHCRHLCYNILQSSAYHDGPFWGNSVLGLSLTFLVTKRFNKPANMFVHTILELDASGMLRIVCG